MGLFDSAGLFGTTRSQSSTTQKLPVPPPRFGVQTTTQAVAIPSTSHVTPSSIADFAVGSLVNLPNRIARFVAPSVGVNPNDVAPEIPSQGLFGNIVKAVVTAPIKAATRIGVTAEQALPNIPGIPKSKLPLPLNDQGKYQPQGSVAQSIFGEQPLGNIKDYGKETLQGFGASEGIASRFALPAGILSAGLDLTPLGGGRKGAIEALAKEAQKYNTAEEFVKAIKANPEKIPTTPEYVKYLKEQDDFVKREKEIYAEMKTMRDTYTGKAINEVPPSDLAKYDSLQKELNKTLSQKTLAKAPEGVIKTHIGDKALDSQLNDFYKTVKNDSPQVAPKLSLSEPLPTEISGRVPSTLKTEQQTVQAPARLGLSRAVPESGGSLDKTLAEGFDPVKYVKEQVAARETARGASGPLSKVKTFLANAKAKLVDSTAPIEDTLYESTKKNKITLLPSEDIHNQIDRVLRAPTLAGQFAKDKGIVDVIRKVDNIDNLDQYLTAKHGLELSARGITTGRDIAKDTALVRTFADKYEPYAKTISEYSQALLDKAVDSGLISKDLAEELKARYPNYVPFQRVFEEVEKAELPSGTGGRGVASLSKQSIIQKIEGSTREVESPIASLLAKTNDLFRQGEKNLAAQLLGSYEKLPGNPFQLRELKPGEKAEHTISFLDNGVKRTFETTKEIAEAAKSLNVQQMNILGKMFALPVRVARLGITGINLPFIGANIAKDQVSAFINSNKALQTSLANPNNFVRSLFSAVAHDKLYEEMVRAGGAGTSFDIARDQAPTTIKSIRAGRNLGSKILYTATHPGELLRAVENVIGRSEEFTRIQQYRGTKQALLGQGMSEKEAITGGARQARDATVNFARRGEWGTVLNSAFLYLNAGIQGTRTLLRNLKTRPVQTATKIAVAALFPVATATVWNLSDPKRKEAYDDIQEYEKQNNIIIVPDNPTKDAQGKWNVIKIPLSQEINNLTSAVRRPIEAAHGLNPLEFGDFARAIIGTVSPIAPDKGSVLSAITPQAIKPTIEAATNQSLFTGIPQVPRGLQSLSPENQVKPYTSGTARLIGNKLSVSPIKVEEFIKGTFGGVGSQALNAVDNALATGGVIPKDQVGGQKVLDAIAARFNKASGGVQDDRAYDAQAKATMEKADARAAFRRATYDPIQALVTSGKQPEADAAVAKLTPEEWDIYKGIRTGERAKNTEEMRRFLLSSPSKAVEFVRSQLPDEQKRLISVMTDEEYALYEKGKNNQ